MRTVIAGGSGFLGTALAKRLQGDGHDVVILTRGRDREAAAGAATVVAHGSVRFAHWNPNGEAGSWADEIAQADAVVNLAGAGIADRRWSAKRKRELFDSRILSTRSLAAAVRQAARRPAVFVQGSGAGYYGAHDNGGTFDESSSPGRDFLGRMCVSWEAEAQPIGTLTRLVTIRSGVVLDVSEGALKKMLPPFRLFVGGPIASGRQSFSWIHRDDWIALVAWAVADASVDGPINATSPNPVINREFARALGRALHRPAAIPVPGFVLRLLFGEMGVEMLIKGQRVVPARAHELGFRFAFPRIDEALTDLIARRV